MADSLLALDLGKTSCRARLLQDGLITEVTGPGAHGLAGPGGVALAEAAILAVALPLLRAAGLPGVATVAVAAAGALSAPVAAQDLATRLCDSVPARHAMVCSDATAAHAGALSGRPGVVLAIGTGAVAVAIGADGVMHRADGWGTRLGDEGSGAWIGLQGLRAALRHHDRRGAATLLHAAAKSWFGPLAGLPALIEGDPAPARLAAGFAPDVARAAEADDPEAIAIIANAASALAITAAAAAAPLLSAPPHDLAITGGLILLGPVLMDRLLAALPPYLRLVPAEGTPLDGVVLLADAATLHEPAIHRAGACAPRNAVAAPGLLTPHPVVAPFDSLDHLATEAVRPGLDDLDLRPPGVMVGLVLEAEREAHQALARAAPQLAAAADAVTARMRAGGRLFYLGAGTPGRLATLDAAELAPTYSSPPGLVIPLLAGGPAAMQDAVEGAEDDPLAAGLALDAHALAPQDAVVGIAASGRTPFVVGGLRHARAAGVLAIAIVNNPGSPAAAAADLAVEILTGPELVAGSTRMTAGTTQKIALNALSTAVMIALGKTYGARMVDLRATNEKLRRRAVRIVQEITGAPAEAAVAALEAAEYRVKPALVALLAGVDTPTAECLLHEAGGRVRDAIAHKGG